MSINAKCEEFRQNVESISALHVPPTSEEEAARIERIINMAIGNSQDLRDLWEECQEKFGTQLYFTRETAFAETGGGSIEYGPHIFYSCKESLYIRMNPDQIDDDLAYVFWHEMRHVIQNGSGYLFPPVKSSLFDHVWFERVMEADAESFNALNAFTQKLNGDETLFNIGARVSYSKIFDAIKEAYTDDPGTLHDGRLRRIAFDAWFENWYIRRFYETNSIKNYHDEVQVVYSWCERNNIALSTRPLVSNDLTGFGRLNPDDKDYLTLPGFRPLDDPYYRLNFASEEMNKLWAEECLKKKPIDLKNSLPKLG